MEPLPTECLLTEDEIRTVRQQQFLREATLPVDQLLLFDREKAIAAEQVAKLQRLGLIVPIVGGVKSERV